LDGQFLVDGLRLFLVRLREFVEWLKFVAREFVLRQQPRDERD
jgi:hypothetical protein